jgi:hypothetical protein
MLITVEFILMIPFSVALTKMPTVPPPLPAVKFTEGPMLGLIEPSVVLVRAHAYVAPEGHVALHMGVTVNCCLPPELTVGAIGLSATDVKIEGGALTVIMLALV